MKKSVSLLAIAVVVCLVSSSFAQKRVTAPKTMPVSGGVGPALAVNHVLKHTYNTTGDSFAFATGFTWTAVDALQTINCPGTTGTCTVIAPHWIQLGGNATAGDHAATCIYVDGSSSYDTGCGFYSTILDASGLYEQTSSTHTLAKVPFGNHTIQTYVWTDDGETIGFYDVTYSVYKP